MTQILDRLEQLGLVHRVTDRDDRRKVLAELTDEGLDTVQRASAAYARERRRILRGLSSAQLERADAAVRLLLDVFTDDAAQGMTRLRYAHGGQRGNAPGAAGDGSGARVRAHGNDVRVTERLLELDDRTYRCGRGGRRGDRHRDVRGDRARRRPGDRDRQQHRPARDGGAARAGDAPSRRRARPRGGRAGAVDRGPGGRARPRRRWVAGRPVGAHRRPAALFVRRRDREQSAIGAGHVTGRSRPR